MPSPDRGHPDEPCRNCGDPTPGAWCPVCGQRKVDVRVSLGTLFRDLVEDQFGVEQRTPATLYALLFRPGHLTREYLDGRVVRYIRPFKLYLLSSLLLFLLVGVVSARGVDGIQWGAGGFPMGDAGEEAGVEAPRDSGEALASGSGPTPAQGPAMEAGQGSGQAPAPGAEPAPATRPGDVPGEGIGTPAAPGPRLDALNVNTGNPRVDALLQARVDRLGRMEPADALREVTRTFLNYTPTLLFILLPVFAGILKLLYIRHPRFYAEHFIFVLHNHAFLFGVFTLAILTSLAGIPVVRQLLALWAAVYFYLALRRVYGQGRRKTLVKYAFLGWCYLAVLGITVPIMVILSLLLAG